MINYDKLREIVAVYDTYDLEDFFSEQVDNYGNFEVHLDNECSKEEIDERIGTYIKALEGSKDVTIKSILSKYKVFLASIDKLQESLQNMASPLWELLETVEGYASEIEDEEDEDDDYDDEEEDEDD